MGYSIAAAVVTGEQVIAVEGDSAFGFSGMETETICRYNLPVCIVIMNNNGVYRGDEKNPTGGSDPSPLVFVKDARYDKMMEAWGGVGRAREDAGRAARSDGRGDPQQAAHAHQCGHRRRRRHRKRPHHESQSNGEEEVIRRTKVKPYFRSIQRDSNRGRSPTIRMEKSTQKRVFNEG